MPLVSGAIHEKSLLHRGYTQPVSSAVAAEVKSKVKNFVHGQALKSKVFAVANLTWYGEITDAVVKHHGVMTYFFGLSSTGVGGDGFSSLALAIGTKYSFLFEGNLTESAAMRALEVIGRVGINSPPIQWHLMEMPRLVGRMPDFIWQAALRGVESKPDAYLGMVYAMFVSNKIQYITGLKSREEVSEDIIRSLARRALGSEPLRSNPLSVRLQELIAQGNFSFTPGLHMPETGLPASQESGSAPTRTNH